MNTGQHFENLAHLLYGLFGLLLILIGLIAANPYESGIKIDNNENEDKTTIVKPENHAQIQIGKTLFKNKCASCHAKNMKVDLTGPALAGVEERWESGEDLYAWIKNAPAFLATGDPYITQLVIENDNRQMNAFPELEDSDIDAILAYIKFQSAP